MARSRVNEFLDRLHEPLVSELAELDPTVSAVRVWVAVEDDFGLEAVDVADSPLHAHELLAALVDGGASAAAYLTYVSEAPERVEARVLTRTPRDSDVRWTYVQRAPGGEVELSEWEYKL